MVGTSENLKDGGGSGPVARAVFKTVVRGDEPRRWVRLPCALAHSTYAQFLSLHKPPGPLDKTL